MKDFEKALESGRQPNIKKLFSNSKTLMVRGEVIALSMKAKGKAIKIPPLLITGGVFL